MAIFTENMVLDEILNKLPIGLKQHSLRAKEKAIELAAIHGLDPEKAGFAALCHDIARDMNGDELYRRSEFYGLIIHPVEKMEKILLHGPVGGEILMRDCGINDPEIIEAVWWHSTFNRMLGPIAKCTFLADKLDPNKASRFSDMAGKYVLAKKNLDLSILAFIEEDIQNLLNNKKQIHPASIDARNWLIELSV